MTSISRAVRHGLGAAILGALTPGLGGAQAQGPALPPLPHQILLKLHADPQAWQAFRARYASVPPARPQMPPPPGALAWVPGFTGAALSNPLLLTDGTVLAHVSCSGTWYRLTPNITGSYAKGTWKAIAPMPSGYAPRFFASGVLPDGRVVVEGGEYNGTSCADVETTKGAIYNPQTNTWAAIASPAGWKYIGDASSIVLPSGTFLLSECCTANLATLNASTLKWTAAGSAGKADGNNNEENWTLLPNGDLLTVDAYTTSACGMGSELYSPATGSWTSAGSTIHELAGCTGKIKNYEAPTQILRPTGQVMAFGSTAATTNLPVWTSTYTISTGKWTSALKMPQVGSEYYDMSDAPSAVLLNGQALIAASPAVWSTNTNLWYPAPTHFFTTTGTAFTQIGDVADSPSLSSYEMNFLVLPTGQILGVETDFANSEFLPPVCCGLASWAPVITSLSSTTLKAGSDYSLKGTQLSGLTQGATYGDDAQADTNFPLVRITITATGHVFYARTYGFSRSVAPAAATSTNFAVPAGIETGAGTLQVVVNGHVSKAVAVTLDPAAVAE